MCTRRIKESFSVTNLSNLGSVTLEFGCNIVKWLGRKIRWLAEACHLTRKTQEVGSSGILKGPGAPTEQEKLDNSGDLQNREVDLTTLSFDKPILLTVTQIGKLCVNTSTRKSELKQYNDSIFKIVKTPTDGETVDGYGHAYTVTRLRDENYSPEHQQNIKNKFTRFAPEELHFNEEVINKIGKQLLGLRHVSTNAEAVNEKQNGMRDGCSLNISFSKDENGRNGKYTHLPSQLEIAQPGKKSELLNEYERGISKFINSSIEMDVVQTRPQDNSLGRWLEKVETIHFMVMRYDYSRPTDLGSWGEGLGRFPKQCLPGENISVLPPINFAAFHFTEEEKATSISTSILDTIQNLVATHTMNMLIQHVETQNTLLSESA